MFQFQVAFIELDTLVEGGLSSQWPNARISEESRQILYRIQRCGVENVILSDIPETTIGDVDLSPLDGLVSEVRLHVQNKETAIRETLRRLESKIRNLRPENVIHLDNKAYGIREANRAGIFTFGIPTGYSTRTELCAAKPNILGRSLQDFWAYVYSQIHQ